LAPSERTLANAGELDNTYFVYLSDNGQAWGDHRWSYKVVPYERSIKVPFVISGPQALEQRVGRVVSNIDLAPTILDLAGVAPQPSDGLSLDPLLRGTGSIRRSGVLLEHKLYVSRHSVPSYCGFRTAGWMFARYASRGIFEEELYDLRDDPHELENIASSDASRATALREATYAAGCDPSIVPPP
jgi:N-acetylglucosamine-6-sulfatase